MLDINKLSEQVESEDATEEEQAEYEKAYEVAMMGLHGEGTAKTIAQKVLNARTPAEGIAEAVFLLIRRTEVQSKGLSDAVKIQISQDLVEEVIDLMIESGRMSEGDITDAMMEEIVTKLYQRYASDAEQRGALDLAKVREDVDAGEELSEKEKPQGYAAMSNQEAKERGLMNV